MTRRPLRAALAVAVPTAQSTPGERFAPGVPDTIAGRIPERVGS